MKSILNAALIVIDVFLLGVIILNPGASAATGGAVGTKETASVAVSDREQDASFDPGSPEPVEKSASQLQAELFRGGYEDAEDAADADDAAAAEDAETAENAAGLADAGDAAAAADTDEHGYLLPSSLAEKLSTTDPSSIDDFDWFLHLVMESGMPDDAAYITDPEDVLGDWKCMVIYDPADAEGKRSYHFCHVHIDCLRQDGTDTMSPQIEWDYEMDLAGNETDESDKERYLGMGEWSEGWIGNSQAAHNVKIRFYSTGDGKQYAYGGITLPDVKSTGICLVR